MCNNIAMDGPPKIPNSSDRPRYVDILAGRSFDDFDDDGESFTPPLEIFLRRVSTTDEERNALEMSSASAFTQITLEEDSLHTSSHAAASYGCVSATSSVSSLADTIYRACASGSRDNQSQQRIPRMPLRRQSSRKRRGGLTRWSSMPRPQVASRSRISSESDKALTDSEFSPKLPRRQGSISGERSEHERSLTASREHRPRLPTRKVSVRSLGSGSGDSTTEVIVSAYAA